MNLAIMAENYSPDKSVCHYIGKENSSLLLVNVPRQ